MDIKYEYECIILSGGGIKGFCTLGALQYIQDNKIIELDKILYLVGTSVGTMISFFIAIGYTPIELMVYLCSNNVFESLKINNLGEIFTGDGIYNYNMINKHLKEMTLSKINYIPTLKELKDDFNKEIKFCTFNFTKKQKEYIDYINNPDLSCLDALRMSSNLPFIFNEYIYNGDEYVDGAIIENFPFRAVNISIVKSLGIYLDDMSIEKKDDTNKIIKIIDKIYNILLVPINKNETENVEKAKENMDVIEIKVPNTKIYKFSLTHSEKLELFSLGYNRAKEYYSNYFNCKEKGLKEQEKEVEKEEQKV